MKLNKVVERRLLLMFWGAVCWFVLYFAVTQDSDPAAMDYMAKVHASRIASK